MNFNKIQLNKRQEQILTYLENQEKPLAVADIFKFLESNFENVAKITVIRDLSLLVKEGYIERTGEGRNTKYIISRRYNLLKKINVEEYFSVEQDERKILKNFNFDIFNLLKEDIFNKNEKKQLLELHQEFRNNFERIKSETIIKKEFERILIEFSWKSSQIEGNTYSLLSTELLIKENKAEKGKTQEETQMILNHKEAFNYVLNNKFDFKELSKAKIENIHFLLTNNLKISKNFRLFPVGITGTNYAPIDNIFQIEEVIEKMVFLINDKDDFFEKSFLSLILLSYIQAFEDGNKRTARMVANAVLLANESTPISYRAVNEVEYKKASLLFYEINNISYFKEIFIEQYVFAVKNYFLSNV